MSKRPADDLLERIVNDPPALWDFKDEQEKADWLARQYRAIEQARQKSTVFTTNGSALNDPNAVLGPSDHAAKGSQAPAGSGTDKGSLAR
jgi:hypothetical protein